jgi:Family of unknown function (DUF5693)
MHKGLHAVRRLLFILIAIGAVAGFIAVIKRATVESRNKTVEIGLEYDEVSRLAQVTQTPLADVLAQFKNQGMTSLIFNEDLVAGLEQTGQARVTRISPTGLTGYTFVNLDTPATLARVRDALKTRGIAVTPVAFNTVPRGATVFDASDALLITPSTEKMIQEPAGNAPTIVTTVDGAISSRQAFAVNYEYQNLRSLGLGLSPDNVQKARDARLQIVGRVGNFAGVTPQRARKVLERLKQAGVKLVIFNGDEVLGYRGLEKNVAAMLRDPAAPPKLPTNTPATTPDGKPAPPDPALELPTGLVYGAVELGKQKGDEVLSATLHGDYIRVHAIQSAELSQLDDNEVIDRFVRAARERNIRFCYVRLLPTAGNNTPDDNPLHNNVEFLHKIAQGIEHGPSLVGGGYQFGPAARYGETGGRLMVVLYALLALGASAGTVWMLCELCPLPVPRLRLALICLSIICVGLVVVGGEMGRRLVALLAGISFPAAACLRAFPCEDGNLDGKAPVSLAPLSCLVPAVRAILTASAITCLGILHVIGLLVSRPFMLRANQFLGIKAQHAIPILIVAFVALVGGMPKTGESWSRFKTRVRSHLFAVYAEPARFGLLLIGLIALAAFYVILARSGNDSGVGASGTEMKLRALLDHLLPVRPRNKEFLVGHPAFVLALAWACRGRRRLAIPLFVVGSVGQVSLLNTFCHIHTPLIISVWHGLLGLLLGIPLGMAAFLIGERVLPAPDQENVTLRDDDE